MTLFAVAWPGYRGEVQAVVVEAADPKAAVGKAKDRLSVGALKKGAVFAVWRLGNFPEKFHVAYDGEPLTESHGATSAKLVTKPLGRSHV